MLTRHMVEFLSLSTIIGGMWSFFYLGRVIKFGNAWLVWLGLLGSLYPLGKFSQMFLFLPEWIRWHADDVGFVPFFATWGALLGSYAPLNDRGKYMRIHATIWYFLASLNEIAQLKNGYGDWWDLAIFMIMYAVTLKILKNAFPPNPIVTNEEAIKLPVVNKKKRNPESHRPKRKRR